MIEMQINTIKNQNKSGSRTAKTPASTATAHLALLGFDLRRNLILTVQIDTNARRHSPTLILLFLIQLRHHLLHHLPLLQRQHLLVIFQITGLYLRHLGRRFLVHRRNRGLLILGILLESILASRLIEVDETRDTQAQKQLDEILRLRTSRPSNRRLRQLSYFFSQLLILLFNIPDIFLFAVTRILSRHPIAFLLLRLLGFLLEEERRNARILCLDLDLLKRHHHSLGFDSLALGRQLNSSLSAVSLELQLELANCEEERPSASFWKRVELLNIGQDFRHRRRPEVEIPGNFTHNQLLRRESRSRRSGGRKGKKKVVHVVVLVMAVRVQQRIEEIVIAVVLHLEIQIVVMLAQVVHTFLLLLFLNYTQDSECSIYIFPSTTFYRSSGARNCSHDPVWHSYLAWIERILEFKESSTVVFIICDVLQLQPMEKHQQNAIFHPPTRLFPPFSSPIVQREGNQHGFHRPSPHFTNYYLTYSF